ncbi:MAG: helix-turn-helix transcriptional regulator [Peptostreptococcaceae bacterium]
MLVREYRLKSGYTQKQIADILGIKQNTYSDKENRKTGFTVKELLMLEILFNVSVSDMFKDDKEALENDIKKVGE